MKHRESNAYRVRHVDMRVFHFEPFSYHGMIAAYNRGWLALLLRL